MIDKDPIERVSGKAAPCNAISIQEVGRWSGGSGDIVTIRGNGSLSRFWVWGGGSLHVVLIFYHRSKGEYKSVGL